MQKANEISADESVELLERFSGALQRLADAEGAIMVRDAATAAVTFG